MKRRRRVKPKRKPGRRAGSGLSAMMQLTLKVKLIPGNR